MPFSYPLQSLLTERGWVVADTDRPCFECAFDNITAIEPHHETFYALSFGIMTGALRFNHELRTLERLLAPEADWLRSFAQRERSRATDRIHLLSTHFGIAFASGHSFLREENIALVLQDIFFGDSEAAGNADRAMRRVLSAPSDQQWLAISAMLKSALELPDTDPLEFTDLLTDLYSECLAESVALAGTLADQ